MDPQVHSAHSADYSGRWFGLRGEGTIENEVDRTNFRAAATAAAAARERKSENSAMRNRFGLFIQTETAVVSQFLY